MSNAKWGSEIVSRVRQLASMGWSHRSIANELGLSRGVIGGILYRSSFEKPVKPSAADQRRNTLLRAAKRAGQATRISLWLNDPSRPQPSLARVKWLERPDP